MKKIYIVRHGETDNNKNGLIQGRGIHASLNETGRMQAEALGSFFQGRRLDAIAVSSLQRTHQTARPVAEMKQLPLHEYADLDEMDYGVLEGSSVYDTNEYMNQLKEQWEEGHTDTPISGGESPQQVFDRATGRIGELIRSDNTKQYWMFVLHGRLIRILLSGWLYGDLRHMQKIQHGNGAINILQYDNGTFEPLLLHYTAHLNYNPETTA